MNRFFSIFLITILSLSFCAFLYAVKIEDSKNNKQKEISPKQAIEKKIEELLEKDQSTAGQIAASWEGVRLWEEEMNRCYKLLLKELCPESAKALEKDQQAWLIGQEAKIEFINSFYKNYYHGTMYGPIRVSQYKDIVAKRAQELKGWLEELEAEETYLEE